MDLEGPFPGACNDLNVMAGARPHPRRAAPRRGTDPRAPATLLISRLQALDVPGVSVQGIRVYADGIYYSILSGHPVLTGKDYQGGAHAGLSAARQTIEQMFGLMKKLWKLLTRTPRLMIFQNPVKDITLTAAILTNAYSLMYGNQISVYFNATGKITLEEYFG